MSVTAFWQVENPAGNKAYMYLWVDGYARETGLEQFPRPKQ